MNYSVDREAMLKRPEYYGKWDAVKVISEFILHKKKFKEREFSSNTWVTAMHKKESNYSVFF